MQACGPVVRPHEILQTLIISIPQPSAAVKSFFELSRNFVSPPEAMSALLLYRQQTADLPPIQRLAAGGEIYARSERGQWPPSAAGGVGAHRQGQKGTGHHMVSCPLLTPLTFLLSCDSLRSRSEMRGAHRDVWCSKGTPLMEAELFAAERGRPAPSGRALVCAANHASEIQGSSAAYKLKDARNRAPVPRLDARPKGVAS